MTSIFGLENADLPGLAPPHERLEPRRRLRPLREGRGLGELDGAVRVAAVERDEPASPEIPKSRLEPAFFCFSRRG